MSTQNSENYSSVEIKNPTNPKLDMLIEALLKNFHSQLDGQRRHGGWISYF